MEKQSLETCDDSAVRGGRPRVYSRTFKAGLLASGTFLTTCVGLASMAVLARVLSMRDYATYKQTMLAYAFAAPLLMLGLPKALYYFLPGEKHRARAILVENLLLLSAMGAVFSLFILLGGNKLLAWRFRNPNLAKTLLILAPYPLFMLPASALGACLMARDRVKQVAVFNVVSRVVMLAAVITGCLVWRTPSAALIGTVLGAAIVFLPALRLMLASCREGSTRPKTSGMWSQLKYSVPLGVAGMIGAMRLNLDKLLVSSLCPPESFAVYVNGAVQIPLIGVVTGSVTAVLLPDMARAYREGDYAGVLAPWRRAATKCAMIILPVMVFLLVNAPAVIRTLFSAKYAESAVPFRVYLSLLPIRIATFGAVLLSTGRSGLMLLAQGTALMINLLLSLWLIGLLGYVGAAIGTVAATYAWSVPFHLICIKRVVHVPIHKLFFYLDIAKVLLAAAISSVVFVLLPFMKDWGDLPMLALLGPMYGVVFLLILSALGMLNLRSLLLTFLTKLGVVRANVL